MLDQLWNSILDLTSQFVIPDWEAVIAMIPLVLLVVVVIWLISLVRRFATAGPMNRGKRRIQPVAPPGIHMPGPSWAPIAVAVGAFLVFWGLVVGGFALWIGLVMLALTLLVWGREALRDYDAIGDGSVSALPPVIHEGPPPGVHMPGPSFRPILASLGVAILFYGLVFGGWLLLVGVILTIATLLGWLIDARREYVKVEEADATGHLENIDPPSWPRRLLWVGALLIVLAVVVDNGIIPPRGNPTSAAGPGASGAPGGSAAPGEPGAPPASGEPAESGAPAPAPGGDVTIVAEGIAFTTPEVTAPASDFTIAFDNRDPAPHDVDILGGDGSKLFDGDIFTGPEVRLYDVTGIDPGQYEFICSVHPNMTGTITVQ